jgi:anti-sigma regulatory factor (Ser/Thr protein kinase)
MATHCLTLAPDIAEVARLIDWVEQRCSDAGFGGEFATRLALALDEAVSNVIHHSFTGRPPPHRIEIRLDIGRTGVAATLIDNGRPFDPSALPRPAVSLPAEHREPGGLGILLMHKTVDRVAYRRSNRENRLRLEKSRAQSNN